MFFYVIYDNVNEGVTGFRSLVGQLKQSEDITNFSQLTSRQTM